MISTSDSHETAIARSRAYLRRKFLQWYSSNPAPRVPRLHRRELAFLSFDWEGMSRHHQMALPDLEWYVSRKVPRAVYHSAAYFEDPAAPTMAEKGWMGCDLVFDIDCDHLAGAADEELPGQLQLAKWRVEKLVHEILIPDFGIEERYLTVVFSGGRGYHVHVRDPQIWKLENQERREISDYVAALGFTRATGAPIRLAALSTEGMEARVVTEVAAILDRLLGLTPRERSAWLRKTQRDYAFGDLGLSDDTLRKMAHRIEKWGFWKQSRQLPFLSPAQRAWIYFAATLLMSVPDHDRQVTYDKHRLIRAPGSLHAGTGLQCMEVPLDDLRRFNPLNDAVVFSTTKNIPIQVTRSWIGGIAGKMLILNPGEYDLPEAVGIFLIGQKMAVII